MPSENSDSSDTDSPDLISYLKKDIPLEEIRDYASPQRIRSLDFVKGFAIVFIMVAHASEVWLDAD